MGRDVAVLIASHVIVAVCTAAFVSNASLLDLTTGLQTQGKVQVSSAASLETLTVDEIDQKPSTKSPSDNFRSKISQRIDLFSCPRHFLRVAPKVNYLVGMGHKMTEVFYVFWYAITRGYCFCFDTDHFGDDMEIYHLLLEPIFPSCQTEYPNRTLHETTVQQLEHDDVVALAANDTVIQWIYPKTGDVWPKFLQEKMPLGHGDVLAFVDGLAFSETMAYWKAQSILGINNKNVSAMSFRRILEGSQIYGAKCFK